MKEMKTLKFPNQDEPYEIVDAKAREMASVQSDWNQDNESAPDYIKNKPLISVGGDTLEWDGNIEGLTAWDGSALGAPLMYWRVSDATPTVEQISSGTLKISNGIVLSGSALISADMGDVIFGVDNLFISVVKDNPVVEGFEFPEKGFYCLSSEEGIHIEYLTIPGYTGFAKKQINPELLPMTTVTIPAGRMRGDIDGDGEITEADYNLALNYQLHTTTNPDGLDEIQIQCCDINDDGTINSLNDVAKIKNMYLLNIKVGAGGDILNNWTVNPNYETEDMQFYTDISVPGMAPGNSAVVFIQGTFSSDFFEGECMTDTLRLYAKLCPIAETKAIIKYGPGNGTVICDSAPDLSEMMISVEMTQAEYDALEEYDDNTFYIITDAEGSGGTSAEEVQVTIPNSWTDGKVTVNVEGVTGDPNQPIIVDMNLTGTDKDADRAVKEAWGCVDRAYPGVGTITFECYGDTPTIAIPLNVVVM